MRMLNEYLDKEYGKPLYDRLNNSKYSLSTDYPIDEGMMVGFFVYLYKVVSFEDFREIGKLLRLYTFHGYTISFETDTRLRKRWMYIVNSDSDKIGGNFYDFIDKNKKDIFFKIYRDVNLTEYLDDFYFFLNEDEDNWKILCDDNFMKYAKPELILRFPHIEKPLWLLHFTHKKEDAISICRHGFQKGTSVKDIEKIAYTHNEEYEKNGKYCYAYNAKLASEDSVLKARNSKNHWAFDNTTDQKVWERAIHYCVMFIGNGVSAYHMTDEEEQVIFNSDTARNFVLLQFENEKMDERNPNRHITFDDTREKWLTWQVVCLNGDVIYSNKSFKAVIKWVMQNYDQYRKPLHKKSDKITEIDGLSKDDFLQYIKNWKDKDKWKTVIEDAFADGDEKNSNMLALANTIWNDIKRKDNMRRNGLSSQNENKNMKKIQISERQERILKDLVKESIKIHKGEKGKTYKSNGKWADDVACPHCDGRAYFTMSISDGDKGRGKIKVTDEQGKEKDTEVQTIALYYCPKCSKFTAHNNMG